MRRSQGGIKWEVGVVGLDVFGAGVRWFVVKKRVLSNGDGTAGLSGRLQIRVNRVRNEVFSSINNIPQLQKPMILGDLVLYDVDLGIEEARERGQNVWLGGEAFNDHCQLFQHVDGPRLWLVLANYLPRPEATGNSHSLNGIKRSPGGQLGAVRFRERFILLRIWIWVKGGWWCFGGHGMTIEGIQQRRLV